MANRQFQQFSFGLEKIPVSLYMKAAIGTSGAITIDVANSKGVKSVVLGTTGKYTVTLQDPYVKLISLDAVVSNATGISASPTVGIVTSGTNVNTVTGGTIVVQFSAAGSATNMASGDTLLMNFVLGNSTAP